MLRVCWCAFIASAVAVAALSIARAYREPLREHSSASKPDEASASAGAPAEPEVAPRDAAPAAPPPALPAADEDEIDIAAPFPAPPSVERPAPETFMNDLIALACLGKLDELAALISPGAARKTAGLAEEIAMVKTGQKDAAEFERKLRALSFEFEDLPGGAVKVRVEDDGRSEDFYLLPDGDAWKLAVESDFEEDTSRESTGSRLKLLALCQAVYHGEELAGGAVYAPSASVLREGLEGTDLYAGVLDAEFARAVDGGMPYGDYVYGRLEAGDGGLVHYATPVVYGAQRETIIVDAAGVVWIKDLEGGSPPAVWPGADPATEGWKREGRK